ncbi:MAG: methenyltetrahydromethanopterin cyclohydrolase [Methylobacteriaceae bacterium]|nr:methenyltetrahydromethanopterin cyclohydrolase [Methylobacteriaceae bacterium]
MNELAATDVPSVSVNARAADLVRKLMAKAPELRIGVAKGELGETLIDAGSKHIGSISAGLVLAEICMGGLGDVLLCPNADTPRWPWSVMVRSSNPVIACLASQYAGWNLSHGRGKGAFFALGSGPARALSRKEALFRELDYADAAAEATLVLESDQPPPAALVEQIARDCRLAPSKMTFIYAPTCSLAGGCQVVARVLEVALHKLHGLKFPLARVVEGMGVAPLSPPHPDFVTAMGRTNDAIIYAGRVHVFVTGPAAEAKTLAEHLPSRTSRDYGRPFAEIFRRYDGDFYAVDPMLFSPAEVTITALETGESFRGGRVDPTLIEASFNA